MSLCLLDNRAVISLEGRDKLLFLNNILSNDISAISDNKLMYALMLSPQGKYLSDFFIHENNDTFYLDIPSDIAENVTKKLNVYKLRSDVIIKQTNKNVYFSDTYIENAYEDPRLKNLGFRLYAEEIKGIEFGFDYKSHAISHVIPEHGAELLPDKTFPLEVGMDHINAINFKKGCYVGQEVTARTKYRGVVRKAMYNVLADFDLKDGDIILNGQAHEIGKITRSLNKPGNSIIRDVETDMSLPNILGKEVKLSKAAWYKDE